MRHLMLCQHKRRRTGIALIPVYGRRRGGRIDVNPGSGATVYAVAWHTIKVKKCTHCGHSVTQGGSDENRSRA